MIKFIDMAWVADKSLDLYCEKVCKYGTIPYLTSSNTRSVNSSVKLIFNEVLDYSVSEYSKKYDKVLIAVPCFPITRMHRISMMSRFLCRNSDFLNDKRISSSQYQETFERFISSKCTNEYITKITDKAYILNGRRILLHDWKRAAVEKFGNSLVNFEKDEPFDSNPNFIVNFEFGDIESKFTALDDDDKFKINMIMEKLTKI